MDEDWGDWMTPIGHGNSWREAEPAEAGIRREADHVLHHENLALRQQLEELRQQLEDSEAVVDRLRGGLAQVKVEKHDLEEKLEQLQLNQQWHHQELAQSQDRLCRAKQDTERARKQVQQSRKEKDVAMKALRRASARPFFKVEFRTNSGGWSAYSVDSSNEIFEQITMGQAEFNFDQGDESYRLSTKHQIQENLRTGKTRKIRISLDVPPYWLISTDIQRIASHFPIGSDVEIFEKVRIPVEGSFRDKVERLLKKSVFHHHSFHGPSECDSLSQKLLITKVWRVEHPKLFKLYSQCRTNLQEKLCSDESTREKIVPPLGDELSQFCQDCLAPDVGSSVNEVFLFHGTKGDNIPAIAAHGFDFRLAAEGFYGQGTYFASQSCKSFQYCGNPRLQHHMIIARVCLGMPFYAKETCPTTKRPPTGDSIIAQPGPMKGHHQGFQSHQEFVIFDNKQAYPEFFVEFRLVES